MRCLICNNKMLSTKTSVYNSIMNIWCDNNFCKNSCYINFHNSKNDILVCEIFSYFNDNKIYNVNYDYVTNEVIVDYSELVDLNKIIYDKFIKNNILNRVNLIKDICIFYEKYRNFA